ncbi:MAG: PAS domain S-box protein [Planctomycetes bacterium]|nr:PAS domain S-box protein [Planctomycetota bacterium]
MAKKKQTAWKKVAAKGGRGASGKDTAAGKPAEVVQDPDVNEAGKPGFAVVGIGASAGGLDAFKQFFAAMPADTGMAFVLIQHLDPNHESLTVELLGRHTDMPVVQIRDEMRVEPNHVYVIPPNAYLTISGKMLHLTEPIERRGVRVPIDFFLRSLADDHQERAIGIILTGTGTDGTLGVREIKAAGGMVMVQDPETAQYDGMLRSAIGTGMVDYVSTIEKMPETLIRYVRHWYVNGAAALPPLVEKEPDHLHTVVNVLRARIKYDFSCYKKGTLTRRVQRRMGLNHIQDMGEYVERLRQDREEVEALYKDLLISVTNFFRDPQAWQVLEKQVVAPLVREHQDDFPIRVWVAGCATGEEPYSIAMLLSEQLQAAEKVCDIQMFASDIDQDALAVARAGIYPESIAADVPAERLRQFFIKGEHTYRISKEIRDAVVFAEQNLISDPPFSKLDLVSCRNLLIYLEPEVQTKILSLFHFALRESGYLFLGNAETVSQPHDLFDQVSRKWRIYRRIGPMRHDKLEFPISKADRGQPAPEISRLAKPGARSLTILAQQLMLQRFAPACVLINRKAEVLYLNGPIDQYLQLPTGEPNLELTATAREGLRTKLRSAVHQAVRDNRPVNVTSVRVKRAGRYFPIRLTVEPLEHSREAEGLLLVTFEEVSPARQAGPDASPALGPLLEAGPPSEAGPAEPLGPTEAESLPAADQEAITQQLEDELHATREDLRCTIEELETSNEELQATNEEVTSINEELQSTNEELETSKEELQSLNEELQTVNSQLEQKIGELESTNNDLNNLLSSTDIATIFLDRRFCIKRFTPAATRLFRVIATDMGRPIRDLALNFRDESLLADAESVLGDLTAIEKQVESEDGRSYIRRIMPYRTEDNRIDGVVITFVDITDRARAEREVREARLYAEGIVETVREPLLVLNAEMRVQSANRSFYETFQEKPQNTVNRLIYELADHEWDIPRLRQLLEEVLPQNHNFSDFCVEHDFRNIGRRSMMLNARAISREDGRPDQILLAIEDVTAFRQAEEQLKAFNEHLEQRVAQRTAEAEKLVEAAPDALVIIDREGRIVKVNERAEAMFGHSRNELLGRPVEVLIPERFRARHPDHRSGFFANPTAGPVGVSLDLVGCRKDGSEFPVDIQSNPMELNDDLVAVASVRDATERRQAQESQARLAAIVQSSPAGILVVGLDGTIQDWNEGAERLYGYSAQEAQGQHIAMLLPPEQARDFEWVHQKVTSGQVVQDYETVRLHKDGRRVDVALTVTSVKDKSGTISGLCSITHDIRERKRLEQQVAEVSDQERQNMGRQLHDSLGQQITAIGMMVASLRQGLDSKSSQTDVAAKLEASVQAAQQQLRALANGMFPVAVDSQGLVVALENLARETAELHEVDCVFECLEPVAVEDNFVATQLFLIAREAVHNAIKHSQGSRVVIRLRDHDRIRLSVRDDGTGISKDVEEALGMGVHIMRHRAGLIGGTLQLESAAGGGTLVRCSVPEGGVAP